MSSSRQAFGEVFSRLKAILLPLAAGLDCTENRDDAYELYTQYMMKNGKPLFFGSVQIRKNYVSFHLMPVYVEPLLLNGLSPELRKRMQGKSCFNFTGVDPGLFEELDALVKSGYEYYRSEGYVETGEA